MTDQTTTDTAASPSPTQQQAPAPKPAAPKKPPSTPAAAAEEKKPERFIPASESRFATSVEFTFPMTSYIPEAGTPLAHLLRPEYWANIKRLSPGCRIWVFAEDEAYWAELLVRKTGQGFAQVQLLRDGHLDQAALDPQLMADHDIQWGGPIRKNRVVRKKDGHVLKEGIVTVEEAQAWLRDHKRALAG